MRHQVILGAEHLELVRLRQLLGNARVDRAEEPDVSEKPMACADRDRLRVKSTPPSALRGHDATSKFEPPPPLVRGSDTLQTVVRGCTDVE